MFWNKKEKIDSDEYLELKQLLHSLRIEFESLKLDVVLYANKLKASRGIKDLKDSLKDENNINNQLVSV